MSGFLLMSLVLVSLMSRRKCKVKFGIHEQVFDCFLTHSSASRRGDTTRYFGSLLRCLADMQSKPHPLACWLTRWLVSRICIQIDIPFTFLLSPSHKPTSTIVAHTMYKKQATETSVWPTKRSIPGIFRKTPKKIK
ncbi:hypothetical protein DL95DRAFT_154698 [Leptodontidium sp. 2 PMI_412]|nr:hypothetical protein DL95DRAFT_154698 [Leptodontidium sp. 2 PMI_412]